MRMIDKLEKKIGRFAIPNLMLYLIIMYLIGFIINIVYPDFYSNYLALSVSKILKGQVWRIVTFLCYPPSSGLLLFALATFVYYSLGRTLERLWGTFRFNLYIFIGIISNIIAAFIIYAIWGIDVPLTANQLYLTMLLGMAATMPDTTFLLFFILPVKAKWLGIFYGAVLIFDVITYAIDGYWANVITIVMSLLNFLIFILLIKPKNVSANAGAYRRNVYKMKFNKEDRQSGAGSSPINRGGAPIHRCAVCGITDADDPKMKFRYCSKCAGGLEYCENHLYTHEHVGE